LSKTTGKERRKRTETEKQSRRAREKKELRSWKKGRDRADEGRIGKV